MLKNQIITATLKAGMSHCTDDEVIQQYVATGGDTTIILNSPETYNAISRECLGNDFTSQSSKILEFDRKLKLIYIESRRVGLPIRTLSEMEKEVLRSTQSNHMSHKKLPTQDGQVDCIQIASNDELETTGSSKRIDYIYFFNNQELEVLLRTMNAVSLPKKYVFMVQSTVVSNAPLLRAYTEYYGVTTHDQPSSVGNSSDISDCGTDTTLFDNSCSITIVFKRRRLKNLMRYNPTLDNRYGLPVFNAIVTTTIQSGQHILIGIQEGVYSFTTRDILFSTFQIRNSAIVIDSVANSHRLIHDGLYDTQSMYYDTDNPNGWIKFYVINGLIILEVSKPTKDEIRSMPLSEKISGALAT